MDSLQQMQKIYEKHLLTKKHERLHNETIKYDCKLCNTTYTLKKGYEQHLLTIKHQNNMPTVKNKYACEPCNLNISTQSNYVKHLTTKRHIINTQVFTCEICSIHYKTELELLKHEKTIYDRHLYIFCINKHTFYFQDITSRFLFSEITLGV